MARLAWFVGSVLTGAALLACSSSSTPDIVVDAGESTPAPTLHGICPMYAVTYTEASLIIEPRSVGYTTLVTAGQSASLTLDVTNSGGAAATEIVDVSASTAAGMYTGGAYPGTGGTCGATLAAGASCTLVVDLVGPAVGAEASWPIVLQYSDALVIKSVTKLVEVTGVASGFTPAPHAGLPQMTTPAGGPVLDHVDLVTVAFADTPVADQISAFGDWVVGSDWYKAVGADYGIFTGTHQSVTVPNGSPATIISGDIGTMVDEMVDAGTLPAGAESLYMFFASSATTVTDQVGVGGWHSYSPKGRAFAVILPGCSPAPSDVLSAYSFYGGHELIEAATDPQLLTYNFGYDSGEVADVCNPQSVMQGGYKLPTSWSNSAAAAGTDPCVPSNDVPYIDVDVVPAQAVLSGVVAGTASLVLTGWSTAPVGDWFVNAIVVGPDADSFEAVLAPDSTAELNNGVSLGLTVQQSASVDAPVAWVEIDSYAPSGNSAVEGYQLIPIAVAGSSLP